MAAEPPSPPDRDLLGCDYYSFFGLERRLALDLDDLRKRFYGLSRRFHPDRFVRCSPAEQQYALQATAILNDAYRTLKDPIARAEYFLREEAFNAGGQTDREARPTQEANSVPPELLEEVFALNMALEELRAGDASVRPQLEQARARFESRRGGIDTELAALFAAYDRTGDRSILPQIRTLLHRRRYVANLVNQM